MAAAADASQRDGVAQQVIEPSVFAVSTGKSLRVSDRLPAGGRLPASSTARRLQAFKSGKVETIFPAPTCAYSAP
ncbi:MAG TPA: hypothetical protein PKH05_17810, partial [Nitrospira sp.]|nr:hypothetical protein [Nitrospira sp.]